MAPARTSAPPIARHVTSQVSTECPNRGANLEPNPLRIFMFPAWMCKLLHPPFDLADLSRFANRLWLPSSTQFTA
jgi:hypothetical protein